MKAWLFMVGLLWATPAFAVPDIDHAVNDYADVLSAEEEARITQSLHDHRERTGVQVAVLLVNTTAGVPIEDYSLEVAVNWAGGSVKRDDGALFVLAIKDRRMRIELGYGLEGSIPDSKAAGILAGLKPFLRAERYAQAVTSAVDGIKNATDGFEAGRPPQQQTAPGADEEILYTLRLMFGAILFLLALMAMGRRTQGLSRQVSLAAVTAIVITFLGGEHGMSWSITLLVMFTVLRFSAPSLIPRKFRNPDTEVDDPRHPDFVRAIFVLFWWVGLFLLATIRPLDGLSYDAKIVRFVSETMGVAVVVACIAGFFLHGLVWISRKGGQGSGSSTGSWQSHSSDSDWSSYSSTSSSYDTDWSSSFDSSWDGGGGDFGGGGASDSW